MQKQLLIQLLQSTIPALSKQLPTKKYQCSDHKLYLQQPVGRRRNSCSFNCFNPQYLRRPNSCQPKKISVLITNYTCRNQLVNAETVARSTASIHNTCVEQIVGNQKRSVFRSQTIPAATNWWTQKQLFVQLLQSTILASTKQLPTNEALHLDQNIHLRQLSD